MTFCILRLWDEFFFCLTKRSVNIKIVPIKRQIFQKFPGTSLCHSILIRCFFVVEDIQRYLRSLSGSGRFSYR